MAKKTKPATQKPPDALQAAKEQLEQELLFGVADQALSAESGTGLYGFENIVGVGVGEKISGGQYTGEQCVTVYVVAKAPKRSLAASAMVPETVRGVRTDVIATGEIHAFPFRGRYRPAQGGVSVGHIRITAGTLGCLVGRGKNLYILSNNHVLANVNSGHIGDAIVQPGPYDGGHAPADTIARLSQFVPINFSGGVNIVDCAIAQTTPELVARTNIAYGRIGSPPIAPVISMLVKKGGRTTQFTRGRITDVSATIRVGYGTAGTALFRNQIVIVSLTSAPFSQGGDSGSLIVTDSGARPTGLLFAGSTTTTIANKITDVLAALSVSIVT
jgi:hypothetical protein